MKYTVFTASALLWLLAACSQQEQAQQQPLELLKAEIRAEFNSVAGTFALAFQMADDTSVQLYLREHEQFHAASTMKTPVMIEVFKQAQAGKFALSDSVPVKNEFFSIVDSSLYSMDLDRDSEGELYEAIGEKRPISSLVSDMITWSSNLATNILIEYVGGEQTTQSMRELGAERIQVLRGVEDMKAFDAGLNNSTTAFDLLVIMRAIANGQAVSAEASDAMTDILLKQQFNELIPANLPEGVQVAHKTGMISGVHHDSGFVILPDGRRYVLVILSKQVEDMDAANAMMAQVSRRIYDFVVQPQ